MLGCLLCGGGEGGELGLLLLVVGCFYFCFYID